MKKSALIIALLLNTCFLTLKANDFINKDSVNKVKLTEENAVFGIDGYFKYISRRENNKVEIFNKEGELLKTYEVENYIVPIDLRDLPNGFYTYRINSKRYYSASK